MRKETLRSYEKFEDGLLRTDACMERHMSSRESQYKTHLEDLPQESFGVSALWEERRLMRDVYKLTSRGIKPTGSETLESFVERHKDILDEGEVNV